MKSDYVIDFERLNELTTSIYDDPNDQSSPFSNGKFAYSTSKSIIKDYIDYFKRLEDDFKLKDKTNHVINTLEYNGILIHKSTIRDKKINQVLDENITN